MSKTTKIIAGLGVVAGLGVAALPIASFAASVDGQAEVIVEVTPAISLSIQGNNDTATGFGPFFESDPSNAYTTSISGATSSNTSSSKVAMSTNDLIEGNSNAFDATTNRGGGFLSTLTVNTNDKGGYTINVKAATTDDINLTNANNDTIDAIETAGTLTAGTEAWGLKTAADYSSTGASAVTADIKNDKWYPITDTDQLVRAAVASATGHANETSTVFYGVATDAAQPTGTYQSTLTYTATTAN